MAKEVHVPFSNVYSDAVRAEAYAQLEFANTYYLAYRDLPDIFRRHVKGTRALDFGCGTGRSTRFARERGFNVIGVDTAPEMIEKARQLDPAGDYRLIPGDDLSAFSRASFDLVLSLFTFDNIAGLETKVRLFRDLGALLNDSGRMVSVVSAPEIYWNEWASFSTRDYPENRQAQAGDVVRIITTDFPDRRPAEDILCPDETYRGIYARAGLAVEAMYKPLATGSEPYKWVNETTIAPWVIYVLERS
ncbi:MAG: class I SAM-dependent methyltransferase [Terriglobales bacterium]